MGKIYYTMSEVSYLLQEKDTTVRFWTNKFNKFLSPKRNAKGNRLYTEKEIEVLKNIRFLVRDSGLSLDAASRKLDSNKDGDDITLKLRDSLLNIRRQLELMKESL